MNVLFMYISYYYIILLCYLSEAEIDGHKKMRYICIYVEEA